MQPFDYFAPQSLPEALGILAELDGRGCVSAGGTDLLLKMKKGAIKPDAVVSIKRLPELKALEFDHETGLRLGSLTTLRQLNRSTVILQHFPCLAHAAGLMASESIRSFATLGGNLCNAAPSADLAPPLIALGAEVVLVGPAGERCLPLQDFFLGPGQSVLKPDELLVEVHLPAPKGSTIYLKHASRAYMDIAVVGVAVHLLRSGERVQASRIALGAVAPVPMRARRSEAALERADLTSERIEEAARLAAEDCAPIDDVRGSAWYRRRMVTVLTRRGLQSLALTDEVGI